MSRKALVVIDIQNDITKHYSSTTGIVYTCVYSKQSPFPPCGMGY